MLYFDNRALKKEIVELDTKVNRAETGRENAEVANRKLVRDAEANEKTIAKQLAELKKVKKVVREQTGADLLVNALRELGVVPKPTKEYDAFAEQARLQQQMASAQQGGGYGGYGGLAQQSGLGSLLGGMGQ